MRLTDEEWAKARHKYEASPKESFDSIAAAFGVSKSAVGKRALAEGWKKVATTPALNDAANRAADGMSKPQANTDDVSKIDGEKEEVDGVDVKVDAAAQVKKEPHPVSDGEAVDMRARVIGKHRDDILKLDVMATASRSLFVKAMNHQGDASEKKAAWFQAKIAADTVKDHVQLGKLKQEMERKAWGMDIVVDPDQLKYMSDEDLEAIAAGRAPRR